MRFRRSVPAETRILLEEQLKKYKKEMVLTREELCSLESWVASGHSPYDNGDYIYTEYGYPMDYVSAMRIQEEHDSWLMSLSEEEREKELFGFRGEYNTESEDVIFEEKEYESGIGMISELPFN